ncbi:hypothetical protein Prudu_004675 [Prunus dulcis]|uniref:DUF7812 domain-containing protein n=1 Tax=Prunus dulcis TaxID=3755 RepID=A0A4Y1QVW5_PRUDU|nr:hypothetical protein Prudu_004675 [Prunus dulcis]
MDWSKAAAFEKIVLPTSAFDHCGVEGKLEDIHNLINVLFEELDRRFKLFFSALRDVFASRGQEHMEYDTDMFATADELPLLLRCCMLVLALADPTMLVEKTQFLLSVLGSLIYLVTNGGEEKNSVRFQKFVSSKFTYTDVGGSSTTVSEEFVASLCFTEPSDPWCPTLCAVLEIHALRTFLHWSAVYIPFAVGEEFHFKDPIPIKCFVRISSVTLRCRTVKTLQTINIMAFLIFADELVMRRLLREYLSLVDSTSSTTEILFQCHFVKGDIGSVLEVISVHFISSVYGKRANENFLKRLFCDFGQHCRVPELSLTSAVSLLQNPVMLSAPKMLQTHLTLLVSEAIDVDVSLKNARPDLRLMEGYLTAFERSVHLYTSHMSGSLMDFHPLGVKCSYDSSCMLGRSSQPSFESYIQQVTRDKIYDLVTDSDSLWDLYLCNMFHRTKSDLMAASITYLMSTSLLKAICSLRHGGDLDSPRTLKDVSSKEYDFVVDIIGCFHQFNMSLPNQKFLFDMMKTCPLIHKTSKWMLLHFSGLLSLCFASGIDFLVKGCISTIMALLHLYVFEESDLVALSSLLVSGSQTFSSDLKQVTYDAGRGEKEICQKSCNEISENSNTSLEVASSHHPFHNAKSCSSFVLQMHQIKESQSEVAETSENACFMRSTRESMNVMEEETEETCNGEVFLNCILGSSQKSDIDDLADFIVCKPAKDYSSWWKDRERYRGMKIQRKKQLRWEKRKNAWKSMVGKKHR